MKHCRYSAVGIKDLESEYQESSTPFSFEIGFTSEAGLELTDLPASEGGSHSTQMIKES